MKARATIIVAGDVQEVGFRAFAMKLGQKMKLIGYVENLFDGTVQIICEGEKGIIDNYIKKLKANDGTVNVENIDTKYSEALNEFKGFRTKITDANSEMFQGFATAGRLLTELKGEVKQVGTKVEQVGTKVDGMADRMDTDFNKMEQKYHVIGEEVKATNENLTKLVDNFSVMVNDLTKIVQMVAEQHKK